ncbi:MAG: NAD-dependent DNA ligase LigA, partial [Clostridia bacterium]|nr:NAD-dependent DNA ligase LigA [Clostridia bacterium]
MDKKQAKERIENLRKQVEYHAKKYYDDDKPEISDFEYDMLMLELRNLEKDFPEFQSEKSLTQKVGGTIKEGFQKVTHEVPLLSLQDVFSLEEVEDFVTRIEQKAKENEIEQVTYVVETKIDGLSASLEYKNGELVKGATRGNGQVGEDVTNNLKTVKTIPERIKDKINITVRGEVFIAKDDFEKMNQEREENEEELFANARNAAAGSLRQLDSKITKTRPLDIYIFNVQKI